MARDRNLHGMNRFAKVTATPSSISLQKFLDGAPCARRYPRGTINTHADQTAWQKIRVSQRKEGSAHLAG